MYIKDFEGWVEDKKMTNIVHQGPYAKVGEIWHTKIGINIGSEVDGKAAYLRPVLIVSQVGKMYFVAPLTTKGKDIKYYHTIISTEFFDPITGLPIASSVLLGQCRIIDAKRLFRKIGEISFEELEDIKKLLYDLYLKPYGE